MEETEGAPPGLLAAMLEPGLYPGSPQTVELRETHISWVFLAGERAYKVKKPLVLPFLDYGTAERRHRMCREEVRLNRRLAPAIYLGVAGLSRARGSWSLTDESDPAVEEHAVEMLRVDEERSLASLASRDDLSGETIDRAARLLAEFHAAAAAAPPGRGAIAELRETLGENLDTLREAAGGTLDERRLGAAEHFTWSFLDALGGEIEERRRRGMVRDCHGDLRAEHVIAPAGEGIYVYDCVEFNPALREIDVGADLAFLIMDLTRLGTPDMAARLLASYRAAGGEPGSERLVSFHAAYRAWVRAKVAALRALELGDPDPGRLRLATEAGELLALGHRFAWAARRPLLLVVCGPSGSGKSTLARSLAETGGWPVVSSDVTRKELAGIEPSRRGEASLYSRERTRETYAEMGRAARAALRDAGGVIADATFHRREEREAFRSGLGETGVRVIFVECRAAPSVLSARVRRRGAEPERVSDADEEVLARQLAEWEPLSEVPEGDRAALGTEGAPGELVASVERELDDRVGGGLTPG